MTMDISFAGCGFLTIYHIGVASCFCEHAPDTINRAGGASAGALAACCVVCQLDLGSVTEDVLQCATDARSHSLGPLHPRFDINQVLLDGLRKSLPDNAHEITSGRLFISLTRVSDRSNVMVSEFHTKEDLIQALICSAFIPFYSGIIPPSFRGTRYVDGGISDNIPKFTDKTVTVSPFSGDCDISPPSEEISRYLQFTLSNTHIQITASNLYRLSRALFPPEPKVLSQICKQGFDDALKYLQRNTIIPCERHRSLSRCSSEPAMASRSQQLSTRSPQPSSERTRCSTECTPPPSGQTQRCTRSTPSLAGFYIGDSDSDSDSDAEEAGCARYRRLSSVQEDEELHEMWQIWEDEDFFDGEEDEECHACKEETQKLAVVKTMPPQVVEALQASCQKVNRGLAYFMGNTRLGQAITIATLPYVLPFEAAYSITRKFTKWLPYMPSDIQWFLTGLIKGVQHILNNMESKQGFRARVCCNLDMTEGFIHSFCKHWLPLLSKHVPHHELTGAEALDIATPLASAQHQHLNFKFCMDFKPRASHDDFLLDMHSVGDCHVENQEVAHGATCAEPSVAHEEAEEFEAQDTFSYMIKVAEEQDEEVNFHYLRISQSVDYEHGQSSVEIHEV